RRKLGRGHVVDLRPEHRDGLIQMLRLVRRRQEEANAGGVLGHAHVHDRGGETPKPFPETALIFSPPLSRFFRQAEADLGPGHGAGLTPPFNSLRPGERGEI
ncbi:MAG: hypothetical protein ABIK62_00140, partial [candidate division WOR-3 bacterium]